MFDKFGEFDSVEEINKAAADKLAEGDTKAILKIAEENGIDKEDAQDYADGYIDELATPLTAALGKLNIEAEDLELGGITEDWKDAVVELCMESEKMQRAVRKKGKELKGCMAALIKYSFENKVQVSDKIVKATKVKNHGKEEPLRGPLYLGFPNKTEVRRIVQDYYGK